MYFMGRENWDLHEASRGHILSADFSRLYVNSAKVWSSLSKEDYFYDSFGGCGNIGHEQAYTYFTSAPNFRDNVPLSRNTFDDALAMARCAIEEAQ